MPVVRISDATWNRLKDHARPLEDTVDDVINMGMDALDRESGNTPIDSGRGSKMKIGRGNRSSGPKLPQKEFRLPLLRELGKLGGRARVAEIREVMEPVMKPRLHEADYNLVSTGEPRWWNAICWERHDLVKEGLFRNDSPRGVWEISETGRRLITSS